MLRDGFYDVAFSLPGSADQQKSTSIVLLRKGCVIGADRSGALIYGAHNANIATLTDVLELSVEFEAGAHLITGCEVEHGRTSLALCHVMTGAGPSALTTVTLMGVAIEARLRYLGTLADRPLRK